ncbi:MAG: hypothetical protein AAGE59_19625 [Cyanobacteria bacterium P01_F01_bin.86]
MIANPQTRTPQNVAALFPLSGNLENIETVAAIALAIINDQSLGLLVCCQDDSERELTHDIRDLVSQASNIDRDTWARAKEQALLLGGSPVADCLSFLVSGLRTPAVAESTLRSALGALKHANERRIDNETESFFRGLIKHAIGANAQ